MHTYIHTSIHLQNQGDIKEADVVDKIIEQLEMNQGAKSK
jgi:hypothetical protein